MMIHHNKFKKMENPQLLLIMIMDFWNSVLQIYIFNRKITHNFPTLGGSEFCRKSKRTSIPTSNSHLKPKGNSGPTSTVHLPLGKPTPSGWRLEDWKPAQPYYWHYFLYPCQTTPMGNLFCNLGVHKAKLFCPYYLYLEPIPISILKIQVCNINIWL
jgi:hypothetical protein